MIELPLAILLWMLVIVFFPIAVGMISIFLIGILKKDNK